MRIPVLLIILLGITAGCGYSSGHTDTGITLAENGTSSYCIVVPAKASYSTMYAAGELQYYLYRMTGARMPVVTDRFPMRDREIMLGDCSHLSGLDVQPDTTDYGDEGYRIRTIGPHLSITGADKRGILYGVYGLLDDHLGCRWFTPDVERIPFLPTLSLPAVDETVFPVFEYREPYLMEAFDGDWAARNRMNRNSIKGTLEARHGGRIEWVPDMFAHTFNKLVPPEKYFKSNPEYYSLIDGRRKRSKTQLCCTNEEVIEIVKQEVLRHFRENPQANVMSISQNDWFNYCQCPDCRKLAEQEDSQMAPVLRMVNVVADAVAEEFPGKIIETLAYQWTRCPPTNLRPRDNVAVRLCTIECCFAHPLDSCDSEENREFVSDLREWSAMCNRLWIWNYNTSYAHYFVPYPNLRVRDDNIRLFAANHVTAVFEQDIYSTLYGELSGLSGWINSRLLWNPDYDEDTAINEYLAGVYGDAAPKIREYIDMLHDMVERENIHMTIWQGPDAAYLTDEVLDRADELWSEAESAAAADPDVLERVRRARLSVDYAIIWRDRTRGNALLIDEENLQLTVNPAWVERVERFCDIATRAGVEKLKEYDLTVEEFRQQTLEEVKPVKLSWVKPVQPGKLIPGVIWNSYEGQWNRLPRFSSLKSTDSGTISCFTLPEIVVPEDERFGVVYDGYLTVPEDGVYTFYTRSSDGSRLYIGNKLIVDNDRNHVLHERMGHVALKAGMHPLTVSYYNRKNDTELEVLYKGPSIPKQTIPPGVLWHKQ